MFFRKLITPISWAHRFQFREKPVDTFRFFPFSGRLLRIILFRLKSDVLACCNTDNKEDGAFFEVESIVVVLLLSLLLLSPSRASLIDFDIELVEVELNPEVDEIILTVSSTSLSCSSLDELEASISCVKHQQQNCLSQLPLHFVTSATVIKIALIIIIMALLNGNLLDKSFKQSIIRSCL